MKKRTISDISILLVDNEQAFLNVLELCLIGLGVRKIYKALSYQEGLDIFTENEPDICILDIELTANGKTGIDLAEAIHELEEQTPIIFITSYFQKSYYAKAHKVRPCGFMNKDLSQLRLLQAIDLAISQLNDRILQPSLEKGQQTTAIKAPYFTSSSIFFRIGGTYKAIDVNEIHFFYAKDKLTYARIGARDYPTNVRLKVLETEFYPKFLRCHKKYLVNVNMIDSILIHEGQIIINEEFISIGAVYRQPFLEALTLLK